MIKPILEKPLVVFDMDGVLVTYNRWDYECDPPAHEVEQSHYFLEQMPDSVACATFRLMAESDEVDVGIISKTSQNLILAREQRTDKLQWLEENNLIVRPELPIIIGYDEKSTMLISQLLEPKRRLFPNTFGTEPISALEPYMILVDDYNPNLLEWRASGGTSVKWLNGINSPDSFTGPRVPGDKDPESIADALTALALTQAKGRM